MMDKTFAAIRCHPICKLLPCHFHLLYIKCLSLCNYRNVFFFFFKYRELDLYLMVKVGERCTGVLGENPLTGMKISILGIDPLPPWYEN